MELQEIYERMHSGKLYLCDSQELADEQLKHLDMLFAYNQLPPSRQKEKK